MDEMNERQLTWLGHLAWLAKGPVSGPEPAPLERVSHLVEMQKVSAHALRAAVTDARTAGATWGTVAEATGLSVPTVFRQWASGGPLVAVRPRHVKRTPGTVLLPDGAVQEALFDLAELAA